MIRLDEVAVYVCDVDPQSETLCARSTDKTLNDGNPDFGQVFLRTRHGFRLRTDKDKRGNLIPAEVL